MAALIGPEVSCGLLGLCFGDLLGSLGPCWQSFGSPFGYDGKRLLALDVASPLILNRGGGLGEGPLIVGLTPHAGSWCTLGRATMDL